MEGKKRPTSVTVIAVLLIVFGSLGLVIGGGALVAGSPQVHQMLASRGITLADNPQAQEMLTSRAWSLLAGSGVILVLAIAILKRQNWGRVGFFCAVPVWIAFTWIQYGLQRYFGVIGVLYLLALIVLSRPKANEFFASGAREARKPRK